MDFGRIPNIERVDFSLPDDDPVTGRVLSSQLCPRGVEPGQSAEFEASRFFSGCPIWVKKEWLGSVYPPKTPAKSYLAAYAQQYNSIELNSTHYHLPTEQTLLGWRRSVGDGFRFCPKVPKSISHAPNLPLAHLDALLRTLEGFGDNLGVTFLQLPPSFSPQHKRGLAHFLKHFPRSFPLAIELRHPAWFSDREQQRRLCDYLAEQGVGLVISDVAGRRDVMHMAVTAPFVLIRFCGNRLHESDFSRLESWTDRLLQWFAAGLEASYFFMHQPEEMGCDTLVRHMAAMIKSRGGADIVAPKLQTAPEQQALF